MADGRRQATRLPVASVLPLLGLAHLDRPFDYRVPEELDADARPGVRVRVRFAGRLVDGYLLERLEGSDHPGRLGWLDRVVSPEVVAPSATFELARRVAARYAGTVGDVLRLAIPPRHARTENEERAARPVPELAAPDPAGWAGYRDGASFLTAVGDARAARAVWQAAPDEDVAARLVELAVAAVRAGRGALLLVPDQRDLDRLEKAAAPVLGDAVVTLAAGLGPTARYRRWLAGLRGDARVVIGTRSAVFAPVAELALVAIWDDGDESYVEPRAPYPHAREVAALRAHQAGCAFLVGGHARTPEAQLLVETGWARDLLPDRRTLRTRMPRISALDESDARVARDPLAFAVRIPDVAYATARAALGRGESVLFQVPRRGYAPALACADCRAPARCRRCHGPLADAGPDRADVRLGCRWCGRAEPRFACPACGGGRVRAMATGARRTAEELGRAFAPAPVLTSGGEHVVAEVPKGPHVVVSTPGVEPAAPGGYGAAVLLDAAVMLARPDLRAGVDALRRWMAAAALVRVGGEVVVVAEAGLAPVQALIRWDPAGFAAAELAQRTELGFPPAVRLAAIDGVESDVAAFCAAVELAGVPPELLGPVELPPGARPPAGVDEDAELARMLLRVPRQQGSALSASLVAAQVAASARHEMKGLRIQIDPPQVG